MPLESHAASPYDHTFGTEEADLVGGYGNLCGDFYREADNVTRGASMAHPTEGMDYKGFETDFYGKLDYQEPDELLAGLSPMGMSSLGGGIYDGAGYGGKDIMGSSYEPGCMGNFADPLGKEFGASCLSSSQDHCKIFDASRRFPETAQPPRVKDPLYSFDESTTLRLLLGEKFNPSKIGNDLLDFFSEQVDAELLKVNNDKFSVKANVFVDNRMCTLKAKVFQEDGNQYALEIGRRSGDPLTFNAVFQKAAKFFKDGKFYDFAAGKAPACLLDPPPSLFDLQRALTVEHGGDLELNLDLDLDFDLGGGAEVAPLLDMAGSQEPSLQAEAAAALADAAAFEPGRLCTAPAFEKFGRLLEQSAREVAYPTAQLLLHLAKHEQAEPWFANKDLLLSIVKNGTKASCLLVKQELAKVIDAAVQRCADKLAAEAKDLLANELIKAAGDMKGADQAAALESIEAALRALGR